MATSIDTRFRVTGMDCAACATKVEAATLRVGGVEAVSVSVTAGTMTVRHAPEADLAQVARKVTEVGYGASVLPGRGAAPKPEPHDHDHDHAPKSDKLAGLHGHEAEDGPWYATAKARLTLVCGLAVGLAFVASWMLPAYTFWIFTAAMLVGLLPIARRAAIGAMNGVPFTIETLMTVAAIGAVIIGASEEAAVVVILFLVGELLEGIATGRARAR